MTADSFLEICLLGGVTIKKNGAPVTGLASRTAEALLAYLACTGRPHPRETLADLLWDDRPQAQAMGNLRVLLSSLRKHLAAHVTISRNEVAFNRASPHMLDTAELANRLDALRVGDPGAGLLPADAAPQLAQAVALYRGDFLAGFHIRDCLGFEEWALVEQERLRRLAMEGLQLLAAHYLRLGNYQPGIDQAARLLELDPLREDAHRQMMLLLARSGRRSAALQPFETCAGILQAALGVPT